jgi:murein hydrolase activator
MSRFAKWISIILFLLPLLSLGQNKDELQRQKKKLQDDIKYTNQLLEETRKNKQNSVNDVKTLDRNIKVREELVKTMEKEIKLLQRDIDKQNAVVDSLKSYLNELKIRYAQMIVQANKSRNSYSKIVFILSSSDFNQAYRRLQYLKQINAYRRSQANLIVEQSTILLELIAAMELQVKEKENLLTDKERELMDLSGEKEEKKRQITELQKKEKELTATIKKNQQAADRLDKEIQKIIEAEIAAARKEAEKKGEKGGGYALTPEAIELSQNFASNKGKLPWPVEKGIIVEEFGEHPHPVLPGIKVRSNGIEIATQQGSVARACFDGVVSGIVVIGGAGKSVIVRHGEFLTVYSNLSEVYVTKGQSVSTKQSIGLINTDPSDGKTVMELQVWKNTEKLDPALWIYRQ